MCIRDRTTFDGLWFRNHDKRRVTKPKYIDGIIPNPNYTNGDNIISDISADATADGSFDIALSLLIAWKQWGDNSGHLDYNGNPISYKTEALEVINGLAELHYSNQGNCNYTTGSIGLDGYIKNGNTWPETTNWATPGDTCAEFTGPQQMYVDYMAPAYFHQFRKIIEEESGNSPSAEELWAIDQLKRGEASSDWIMGQIQQSEKTIPFIGSASISDENVVTFGNLSLIHI